MKTIVTTEVENKKETKFYPIITFDSKTKAKKWLKKLKIDETVIGSTKLYNNGEILVTEGKFNKFTRTIWTEKEYNKLIKTTKL